MVTTVDVAPERFGLWGVNVKDYKIGGVQVDFETVAVAIATQRATTIEHEVQPLTVQMTARNRKLQELGKALGDLTNIQVSFKADAEGGQWSSGQASPDTVATVNKIQGGLFGNDRKITKSNLERAIQLVKSEVDKLNNEMQTDTTRVQSYVSRRDESFSMASSIMSSVNETCAGAIRAMGA